MTNTKQIKKFFTNTDLFDLAMTHKSWVNENTKVRDSNERLEFLGDAILEFVVSKEIYSKFPNKEEGYLTALRANLVNTVSLAEVGKKLNLGKFLYLSRGEEEGGGRENTSILANTVEALIGAIFMDKGLNKAEKFIFENLLYNLEERAQKPLKDAKSNFQEIVQAKGYSTPFYEVVEEKGPDHNKEFSVQVIVEDKVWGFGVGKNKSQAAQNAAQDAIEKHNL